MADAGPVDPRADAAQQRRQQGQDDQRAHERDEHAAQTHAAQQRHGDHEQGAQADRDRSGARDHGVPGVLHRHDDRGMVVEAVRTLLAPPVDDEQRVVDRDTEPDQRDEELDDEAHVEDVGPQEHDRERRQDRHGRDEQGNEREQRREQEQQHRQRAEPGQDRVDEQARLLGVLGPLGEQVVAGDAPLEPGLGARFVEDGLHGDVGADVGEALERLGVDQRVGGAAVLGQEDRVTGVGVADHAGGRQRLADLVEDRGDAVELGVDGGALGHRHDGDGRRVGAPVVERLEDLLLGLVARLPGQREVDREPLGGAAGGGPADHEHHEPEQHHQAPVVQDELGETDHRFSSVRCPAGQVVGRVGDRPER